MARRRRRPQRGRNHAFRCLEHTTVSFHYDRHKTTYLRCSHARSQYRSSRIRTLPAFSRDASLVASAMLQKRSLFLSIGLCARYWRRSLLMPWLRDCEGAQVRYRRDGKIETTESTQSEEVVQQAQERCWRRWRGWSASLLSDFIRKRELQ